MNPFTKTANMLFAMIFSISFPLHAADIMPPTGQSLRLGDVIRTTLAKQPAINLGKEQLQQGASLIELALAEFDWKLDSILTHGTDYQPTGATLLNDSISTSALDLRFTKKTTYGFSVEPGVTFKSSDTTVAPSSSLDSSIDNSLRVFFNLNVPLLQGFGQKITTARETSARHDYEANRYELLHTISLSASDAINAYWDYTAAYERLKHGITAEERAQSFVANTESLVNADETPQSELVSAHSNLLEKKISREHAELNLVETRQRLGLVSGSDFAETAALKLPADTMPVITEDNAKNTLSSRQLFVDSAFRNRGDLLALGERATSSEFILLVARDATAPKLDLVSGIGFDGYQTGPQFQKVMQTTEFRQKYPDWSIGLRFSYPLENHGAKGGQAIATAQLNQAKIRHLDLKRTIETSLSTVLYSLQNVAREIEKAGLAASSYQKSVENEQEKYLMGESTLFDLLFMQDKLDSAQLSIIDARYRGAILLTRLLLESGRMLDCRATECELTADSARMLFEPAKRISP